MPRNIFGLDFRQSKRHHGKKKGGIHGSNQVNPGLPRKRRNRLEPGTDAGPVPGEAGARCEEGMAGSGWKKRALIGEEGREGETHRPG
jgi:hypothetical protein